MCKGEKLETDCYNNSFLHKLTHIGNLTGKKSSCTRKCRMCDGHGNSTGIYQNGRFIERRVETRRLGVSPADSNGVTATDVTVYLLLMGLLAVVCYAIYRRFSRVKRTHVITELEEVVVERQV